MKSAFVRRLKPAAALFVFAAAAAKCDNDPVGPLALPAGLEIRAAATVFPIQIVNAKKNAIVSATLVNNGHETILINYCGARIFKRVNNSWSQIWAQDCAAVIGVLTKLERGDVKSFGATLSETGLGSLGPIFTFEPGATYSMSVPLSVKTGDGDSDFRIVDPNETMSTTFTFSQ